MFSDKAYLARRIIQQVRGFAPTLSMRRRKRRRWKIMVI
jgi:hypothetical protein